MGKIKTARRLMASCIIFFIAYNSYYGWNKLPENELEKSFDLMFSIGTKIACVIYLLPIFDLYEKFVKKNEL